MTSPPPPASEAHRRIAALVAEHGYAWVDRKLGRGEGTAKAWLTKGRKPQARIRQGVAEALGLAPELWDAPPAAGSGHQVSTSTQRASAEVGKGEAMAPGAPLPEAEPPADASDARANVEATLRILRMRLAALPAAEKIDALAKVCNAITASSRLLARLSGQLDVTEAQILRSDAWKKLVRLVRDVLEAFPDAAKALDKAIAEYEAGN